MKKHFTLDEINEDLRWLAEIISGADASDPDSPGSKDLEEVLSALESLERGDHEPAQRLYSTMIANIQKLVGDWRPSQEDLEKKVEFKEAVRDKSSRKHLAQLYQQRAALK